MRKAILLALAFCLLFPFLGGYPAQQPADDYLTAEEVKQVRDAMDPAKRIQLFLDFAGQRLGRLEDEIRKAGGNPEKNHLELQVRFDHYIRAVDDVAGHLEMWLERGGVDLRKLRKQLPEAGQDYLARLAHIEDSNPALLETDLQYDLEDAQEATREMLDLGGTIPDAVIPPRMMRSESGAEQAPEPGRPTLRRRGEDKTGEKPPPKPPPF